MTALPPRPLQMSDLLGAIRRDKIDIVKDCLDAGVNVNSRNEQGSTILLLAIKNNKYRGAQPRPEHIECIRLLLERGAEVNARNENNSTPLHWAAINGLTRTAELLIRNGADIHARDNEGSTPLMEAAQSGSADISNLLIDRGASREEKNNFGVSAASRVENGHNQALKDIFKKAAEATFAGRQRRLRKLSPHTKPSPGQKP